GSCGAYSTIRATRPEGSPPIVEGFVRRSVSGSVGPLPSLKGNLRRPHHRCWRRAFRKGS
ncbi:unnamed protein product, partial [Musa acuminata subsp. burmannicoides]